MDLIDNENLLLEAIQLLEFENDASNMLLAEHIIINNINNGIQDISSGKVKTHDQAYLETEKWLKEQ